MENECPLSCGICELCPTPAPPNTALPPPPPTPRACSPSGNLMQIFVQSSILFWNNKRVSFKEKFVYF